ncbi:MAG: hypothetical protein HQL53_02875 [Magnetococcales bacterium]|nr:hypothetical protein [Magnetococcales bacterium]
MNLNRSSRPSRPPRFDFQSGSQRRMPRYGRIVLAMVVLFLVGLGVKSCSGWKEVQPTVRYERLYPPPDAAAP